jgi:hypothetical protein
MQTDGIATEEGRLAEVRDEQVYRRGGITRRTTNEGPERIP